MSSATVEQGFLLGCSKDIYLIDKVAFAPCKYCTATEFMIDARMANEVINKWSNEGVLFCGVAHSHVGGSTIFSTEDESFAKMLIDSFNLPFIWFGLIVEQNDNTTMLLKRIHESSSNLSALSDYRLIL